MAKDPRFNFYPDNWSGGTKRMTLEQKGAYLELILLNFSCFNDGLPGFTESEARHAVAHAADGAGLWSFLKPKFQTDGKFFWSERMLKEFHKSKKHSEEQSKRALKRWEHAAASPAGDACNGNGIGNGINNELKGGEGENYPSTYISADELFMEYCTREAAAFSIDLKKCMDDWDGWYCNKFPGWRANLQKEQITIKDLKKSFQTWLLNPKSRNKPQYKTAAPAKKKSFQEFNSES